LVIPMAPKDNRPIVMEKKEDVPMNTPQEGEMKKRLDTEGQKSPFAASHKSKTLPLSRGSWKPVRYKTGGEKTTYGTGGNFNSPYSKKKPLGGGKG